MSKSFTELRIVFMGTPDFAVASLKALVEAGCSIVGVITAPDKAAGRGMKIQQSAVKQYAVSQQLLVLQPEKLKDPEFLGQLKNLQADLQVVVAFRMLPELVWNMPPLGTINVHGSLLPDYRGAAPINRAVMNGETKTGVTTFKLQHQIDTGNILMQESMSIAPDETASSVHDRMKELGASLLIQTIKALATNSLEEKPQSFSPIDKHAPKIFTKDCEINWHQPCINIYNHIRGLAEFPGAFTFLQENVLKIFRAKKEIITDTREPGTMITDGKTYIKFKSLDGYIHATDIQLAGKKRMTTEDFLRGYQLVSNY
ncbi:MAG: methionyl-tRNA formyltransferase [Sediminibacterium sp.]|nr:methionyl-tRNA formyltransferase [Sediminibacterium sp.]